MKRVSIDKARIVNRILRINDNPVYISCMKNILFISPSRIGYSPLNQPNLLRCIRGVRCTFFKMETTIMHGEKLHFFFIFKRIAWSRANRDWHAQIQHKVNEKSRKNYGEKLSACMVDTDMQLLNRVCDFSTVRFTCMSILCVARPRINSAVMVWVCLWSNLI